MSYHEDFNKEQRRDFESDPFITGSGGESFEAIPVILTIIAVFTAAFLLQLFVE